VQLGDVLVSLDAAPVRDIPDVQAYLWGTQIGKVAKASIIRGGTLVEATVVIGERPVQS
jgi:S1-C subfamily serine protease